MLVIVMMPLETSAQSAKPIYENERYALWPDHVEEGLYSAHALSRSEIESTYPVDSAQSEEGNQPGAIRKWSLTHSIEQFPQVSSDYMLLDALYNLSLEELVLDTRSDGAFNAGAKWQGVWTRDVSYSILLSLAAIQPEAAKASLLHKVKRDRIVQDTGTGGSWPVSSDRVTWALAAWEIYLTTDDREWLKRSYEVIRNSILDDQQVVIDPETGLARGESTFLDWREQTYPRWMEPADIYSAKEVGTNAVFYRAYRILEAMAKELGQLSEGTAKDWGARADRIRSAINEQFWLKDRGYYGQYLYGRVYQSLSPRSEALGEAFAVLFDIAEPAQQDEILRSQPLMDYGVPTVFPQTPNIPPYHNRSVWPFVQAFSNLAAAKRENGGALLYGLASIYRESALFLTNKENFVADTGSPVGTEINSDRQLWSVAGNLAMVYRVLFGMQFEVDGLHLHPVIPEALKGRRRLTNFRYRQAVLSLEVSGFGGKIQSITLDGKPASPVIPANLSGNHSVIIQMDNLALVSPRLNFARNTTAPDTPALRKEDGRLIWQPVQDAAEYAVYRNGKLLKKLQETEFRAESSRSFAEYQVSTIDNAGIASFLSAPVVFGADPLIFPVQGGELAAGSSEPFVTLEQTGKTGLALDATVPVAGRYSLSFRYANGSGPVNTENKCAIRTLFVDGKMIGPVVLPQRGNNDWDNWGVSSRQVVSLSAGAHPIELRLLPSDENMNGEVNRARVSSLLAVPIE